MIGRAAATRFTLCCAVSGLTLVLSLATAVVQSKNRTLAISLDALKEECDMLEAVNAERCERILALDWRPLPVDTALAASLDAAVEATARSPQARVSNPPKLLAKGGRATP